MLFDDEEIKDAEGVPDDDEDMEDDDEGEDDDDESDSEWSTLDTSIN